MYSSFDQCMHALLSDFGLEEARGGQIIKQGEGFNYRLFNQPEIEGEEFFDLYPSSTSEVKWRAWPVRDEAKAAYDAFISNPKNGQLIEV